MSADDVVDLEARRLERQRAEIRRRWERELSGEAPRVIDQSWVEAWCAPPADGAPFPTPEMIDWIRGRPEAIRPLLLRFPPLSVVAATRPLRVPSPGTFGIVVAWREPPRGEVDVIECPTAEVRCACQPGWLEVVGYKHGLLTPGLLRRIWEGR